MRPLTWSDLRLRLAVVRDLRTTMHADLVDAHASFDTLSARGIAGRADSKETVNLDDLANGKGPSGMTVANHNSGTGGHPRK